MEEKKWCVYIHLFPNGKRYVGITSKSPKARWGRGKGYKDRNIPICRAIEKYGWDNIEHIIVATGLAHEESCKMEQDLIKKYKTNISRYGNDYGYNLTDGGEGSLGHKVPESLIEQNRERLLGKTGADCPNSRVVICEGVEYASLTEFKQKNGNPRGNIGAWLLGKVGMPSEWYEKGLCYKDLGTDITYKSLIADQRARKIVIDNIVFNSLKECANYLKINSSNLSLWLNNKKRPSNEIISRGLRYEDEEIHIFKENCRKIEHKRSCECDGKLFESLESVSQYLGIKKATIWAWLKGKNKMPEEYVKRGLKYAK